jgi:hypothetical protein
VRPKIKIADWAFRSRRTCTATREEQNGTAQDRNLKNFVVSHVDLLRHWIAIPFDNQQIYHRLMRPNGTDLRL